MILENCYAINTNELCDEAYDGQQALDLVIKNIEQNNYDACDYALILMDCNMPRMDGYESSRRIREFCYENSIVQPIITAVTGHLEQDYVKKAVKCGINQILGKPI